VPVTRLYILVVHNLFLLLSEINPHQPQNIKMLSTTLIALAGLAPSVLGHGIITSPPIRGVGTAMVSACGESVATLVSSDIQSHIEGLPEAAAATVDFDEVACNVFLCKGLQYADNVANVQSYVAGQVVNFLANISIAHEGPMNVSVVETATNTIIGESLIVFDSYADESLVALPANNTNFNVTIPTTLGTSCANAGDCVCSAFLHRDEKQN
jgi:hypothetical protein